MAAPGSCRSPVDPGQPIPQLPWHQRWLNAERVWPFSTGAGVRVAVVDSGVDDDHPQLAGQVATGFDALGDEPGGNVDCVSHGTAVASVIAARPVDGIGFHGLAPDVEILPVRVSERVSQQSGDDSRDGGPTVTAARFAQAIRWAVDNDADVINMSVTQYLPDSRVRDAITYALAEDVVVVAAAGNLHQSGERPDPPPFPAAYDGVLGVGAIDQQGLRVDNSQIGPYVDLVAPGGAVVAATRRSGHDVWSGTSFATPMVAATAALVRAAQPELTAAEVVHRILATVDPAAGAPEAGYGIGVVNPYRAVTERLTGQPPVAIAPMPDIPQDPAAIARAEHWSRLSQLAVGGAAGMAGVVAVVTVAVLMLPRGRRRRWRSTRHVPAPVAAVDVDEPDEAFFRVPGPPRPD
ncbi:type VII secretion-associated serine protease mycosin [Solwaraspora sp. WMMD406]|uniref:type VII secretion-associated serine protease mycosin n=1 Tax=Solwaraspora sp. WMMD406 TaxID=3016095 RepID=UPI002417F2A4|nr:type VII secretion-associated serine protease mycosin [Solwaraspora sp. WMMD406]MDG4762747.1 type VII secretion-associated serine protease mycosin [Solwaraspora sp. WMMD406]